MLLLYLHNHLEGIPSGYPNCPHEHDVSWWLTGNFCSGSDFLKESSLVFTGLCRGIVCHRICRRSFLCPPCTGTFGKWDVALIVGEISITPHVPFPVMGIYITVAPQYLLNMGIAPTGPYIQRLLRHRFLQWDTRQMSFQSYSLFQTVAWVLS